MDSPGNAGKDQPSPVKPGVVKQKNTSKSQNKNIKQPVLASDKDSGEEKSKAELKAARRALQVCAVLLVISQTCLPLWVVFLFSLDYGKLSRSTMDQALSLPWFKVFICLDVWMSSSIKKNSAYRSFESPADHNRYLLPLPKLV